MLYVTCLSLLEQLTLLIDPSYFCPTLLLTELLLTAIQLGTHYILRLVVTFPPVSTCKAIMSNNNTAGEDTPLLRDQNGAEEAQDSPKPSTWDRVKNFATVHFVNIILSALLLLFIILFLLTALLRHPQAKPPPGKPPVIPTPGHGPEICSSAGCVLASATLLRSISPRLVAMKISIIIYTIELTRRVDLRSSTLVKTSALMSAKDLMLCMISERTRQEWAAFRS